MPCWRSWDRCEPRDGVVTWALLAAVLAVAMAPGVSAEDDARDPAYWRLNESFVERHVLPRYARLADASGALDAAARRFCEWAASIEEVRAAFHAAADAWHDAEHLRFGPIESRLRAERLAFWPDPRNATGRQLAELLAGRDPATLTPEGFLRASAAVQGLPAVERLLFDQGAEAAFRKGGDDAVRRCQVFLAITRNAAAIAGEVQQEWTTGDAAYARRFTAPGPGNVVYPPSDATVDVLKSLYGSLERVASLKLAKPLGASLARARPTLAEEWRSGRALRDVRLNLAAARALYLGEGEGGLSEFVREVAGAPELDARLRRGFDAALGAADRITGPLETAMKTPRTRPTVERLLKEVRALRHAVAEHLTTALGVPLGFNALDGD